MAVLVITCLTLFACEKNITEPRPLAVASVEVTPSSVSLLSLGDTAQLTASARNAGGGVIADKAFTWKSSDENVATVSATGLVTTVADGLATITATTDSVSGTAVVTVSQTVASVEVTPSNATLTALGDAVQLSASAVDHRGNVVSGITLTWHSSDTTVVTADSVGRVVAVRNGSATVTAEAETVAGTALIAVAQVVAVVLVTPDTATLSPADTVRLVAAPEDSRGNPVADRPITWASADTTVARVSASGLVEAAGDKLGPVAITATIDGQSGGAEMDVVVSFASVAAGMGFTCALSAGGAAYCWGLNRDGQLGNGSTTSSTRPVAVTGGLTFGSLAAGTRHACGITPGGDAYCWGGGILGDGSSNGSSAPVAVGGGLSFASVSAGGAHTCGVTTSGSAHCWGTNTNGALGDGTGVSRTVPVPVTGGLSFQSVSAGDQKSCGLSDGAAYCWGYLTSNGGFSYSQLTPSATAEGVTWQLLTTFTWACGVATDAATYCWLPTRSLDLVPGGLSLRSFTVGGNHICGIDAGAAAYCWGRNHQGQLGDGTTVDRTEPAAVVGDLGFAVLSASRPWGIGRHHTCGITTGGSAYCWGSNVDGQLGDGGRPHNPGPTLVMGSRQ
jgi:uncharacterized protein YjdB